MKTTALREVLIGAAAMLALALTLAISYWGGTDTVDASFRGYRIFATFNQVDGLAVGDPVYLAGIRVGTVENIALDRNFRVVAIFRIETDVAIPADTAAAIQTDGLFGSKFISLDPGGDDKTLADGDRIEFTQDAVVVGDLLNLIIDQGKAARERASEGK